MALLARVAVIGAGVAGLAAARELHREGHRVVVLEKRHSLGGTWLYDSRVDSDPLSLDPARAVVGTSLYHSLRTNLPRQIMGFLDYPFAKRIHGDQRTFPGHEEVLWFLNEFADEFQLRELIRFCTEVVRAERAEGRNDEWVVESRSRGSESAKVVREVYDAVVVCNGHYTEPHLVEVPGTVLSGAVSAVLRFFFGAVSAVPVFWYGVARLTVIHYAWYFDDRTFIYMPLWSRSSGPGPW